MPNPNIQNTILDRIERISHIGYWRYNIKENELFWSDEVYRIHGLNFAAFTPDVESAINAYHPEDKEDVKEALQNAIDNKASFEFQKRIQRPSNEIRYVSSQGECELDKNGKVVSVFGTLQDITELKEIQEKLEQSNKDLDIFASSAAHDLKAPLRSISGFMTLLRDQYGETLDETAHEYINFAIDGAQDLSGLVENLLEYSQIGTEDMAFSEVNLDMLVKSTIRLMKEEVQESSATFDIDELPIIICDEHKIRRLFANLIGNALKYRIEGRAPHIQILADKKGKLWLFSVKDNGIGIPKDKLEDIFVMFKRLQKKEDYNGTGIGLASCEKIVKLHDGKIWAKSGEGEGSTFYFSLPQKDQETP